MIKKIMLLNLLIFQATTLQASARVKSCTAIPGRAKGEGSTGGSAYCGSQKKIDTPQEKSAPVNPQGSSAILGAIGSIKFYTNEQIEELTAQEIRINDGKAITTPVITTIELPSPGQERMITYMPGTGPLAFKICRLIISLKQLTSYEIIGLPSDQKWHSYQLTLYRIQQDQESTSVISVIEIMNATLPTILLSNTQIFLIMEPDGSSHIARDPINLPTGVNDDQFLSLGKQ